MGVKKNLHIWYDLTSKDGPLFTIFIYSVILAADFDVWLQGIKFYVHLDILKIAVTWSKACNMNRFVIQRARGARAD